MPTRAEGLRLTVNSPCEADWDSMAGNEQIRFCEHCAKSVHNISALTRKDAQLFLRANRESVCVRFHTDARGRTVHETTLHRITRRASKAAAGAFGAFVALGASALAQTPSAGQQVAAVRLDTRDGASLTGTILDPNGATVAGASVTVINTKTGYVKTATTDASGVYRFDSLEPGTYTVEFEAEGFDADKAAKVELQQGVEQRRDSLLALAGTKPAQAEESEQAEQEDEADEAEEKDASCAVSAADASQQEGASSSSSSNEITELPAQQEGETRTERPMIMGAISIRRPENPLVEAAFDNDVRAAKRLIALGVDVNVLDKEANTTALIQAVSNNNTELVNVLLGAGADVNMKDTAGDTALTSLSDDTPVEMVRALIAAGARVNHKNGDGSTPLISAADNDTPEVLKELIEAGAKVNAKRKDGGTALMEAARYGLIENVKLLLASGADVNAKNHDGETALSVAKDFAPEESAETPEAGLSKEESEARKAQRAVEAEERETSKKIVALLLSYGAMEE